MTRRTSSPDTAFPPAVASEEELNNDQPPLTTDEVPVVEATLVLHSSVALMENDREAGSAANVGNHENNTNPAQSQRFPGFIRSRQKNDDNEDDHCACCTGCCSFPNGKVIILSQVLWITSFFFSFASMVDCQFVTAVLDPSLEYSEEFPYFFEDIGGSVSISRRGYGFFFFQSLSDDSCYWVDEYDGDALDRYFVFMGQKWLAPRATASLATAFCFGLMIWLSLLFPCVAHNRLWRIALQCILWLLVFPFQATAFAVLNSEFCTVFGCLMGRSVAWLVVALVSQVAGALVLCFGAHGYRSERERGTEHGGYYGYGGGDVEMMNHHHQSQHQTNEQDPITTADTRPYPSQPVDTQNIQHVEYDNGINDVQEIDPREMAEGMVVPMVSAKAVP